MNHTWLALASWLASQNIEPFLLLCGFFFTVVYWTRCWPWTVRIEMLNNSCEVEERCFSCCHGHVQSWTAPGPEIELRCLIYEAGGPDEHPDWSRDSLPFYWSEVRPWLLPLSSMFPFKQISAHWRCFLWLKSESCFNHKPRLRLLSLI